MVMFKVKADNCRQSIRFFFLFSTQISGVGFTKFCRDNCLNAGIKGWVKNSKKGTIVGKMQGTKPEVDKM